jgi:hypothetical protein
MRHNRQHAIAIGSLVEIIASDDEPHDPLTGLRLYVHSHIPDESIEVLHPLRYTLTVDHRLIGLKIYGHPVDCDIPIPYHKGAGHGACPTEIDEHRLCVIQTADEVKVRLNVPFHGYLYPPQP